MLSRQGLHPDRPPAGAAPAEARALRVSDREREDVVGTLREHAGAGRLDVDELAERLEAAWAARTGGDLEPLTADLPSVAPARRERAHAARRRDLSRSATTYATVMLLLVAVWALTGAGYFWPVWPMLGWGICIASEGVQALGRPGRLHP